MPKKLYSAFIALMTQFTLSHAQDFATNPIELSGMTNLYGDVRWADLDGDKDPDALIAGYFTGVQVFQNINGQIAAPVEVISGQNFSYKSGCLLLDFDANGYIDIVLEGGRTVDVLLNDGNFGFTLHHTGIDFMPTGTAALSCYDMDGDADLDIVINNQIFENQNGSWTKSIVTMPPTTGLRIWGDLNADGLIDFVHLDYSVLVPYVSKGDGIFEMKTAFGSARQDGAFFLADMDGDGDLDLLGSDTDYRYALYANSFAQTGTVTFQKNYNFDFSGGAKVDFGDTNRDGLPDLLVHGFLNNSQTTTFILENASTPSTTAFNVNNLDIPGAVTSALGLVDFNGDGALDIHLSSNSNGTTVYGDHKIYINEQSAPITPAPSTPTGLQTLQNETVMLKWTPDTGKQYAMEIEKDNEPWYPSGSISDGTLLLPKGHLPLFSGQYVLNNLPGGSYRWRVQAIDYASRASAFSTYQTFTISEAPHTLSLTALDYRSVSLSWIYDGSTPDGFQIFRKSSSQPWMKAGEVSGSATSFNDNTLDENLWYEYFVKAVSGSTSSAGSNSVYHFTGQFIQHEFGTNNPNIVPRTAVAADLDGDEDLDFQFMGWVDSKSQTGMKNDGAGNFTQTLFVPEGTYDNDYGELIHAGDMDGDGDTDICAYMGPSYNQKITVLTNVNGTYSKTFVSPDISSAKTTVKDFNNDGLMDIFYPYQANNWSPYVYRVMYQQRDGTFHETSIKLEESEISYRGYKVIDINSDGFHDIFFTGTSSPTKPAMFAMNQSGDGFTFVETSVPSMYDLHFQDLNADGIIDLLFKHNDNRLVIQYGKGDNIYEDPIFLRAFYIGDEMKVETVDMDYNGWPELVVYDSYFMHIINNNGNGSFEVSSIEFGTGEGTRVILTDLEKDGDADMLRLGASQWQGTSTIYENQQSAPSRTNQPPSAPGNVESTRAAGRTTITWNVAADDTTPAKLITYNVLIKDAGGKTWVHPGTNAAGTFRNVYAPGNAGANAFFVVNGLPAGSYTAQVQAVDASFALSAWSSPLALEVAQGAGDLSVERILLNKVKLSWALPPSSDGLVVERKTTEGGFKMIAELGAGVTEYIDDKLPYNQQFTYRVTSIVNGITAAPSNTAEWNTGMWVVNDTSFPNAEKSIDVGDFTGDGKMDVVMTGFFGDNQNHERVKAYFESTAGGFTRQDFGDLMNPSLPVVSLADLNQDGQLDIYEYGYSSNSGYIANIYQNNGNKTFSAYNNIITSSNSEILSYLDFDRDNDLDLYLGTTPNSGNPSARLVRNTGAAYENTDVFSKTCEYYSCNYQSISGDFDNDGDDDILRANVLYLNASNGLSEATVFTAVPGVYRKVDFNGDGWLDIISLAYEYYATSKLYENMGLDAEGHLQFQEKTVSLPGGSDDLVEHAADFDHDGDVDLLFVAGTISVLYNDNGAFHPYTIDRFRSGGASKIMDYDQDGDLDVILTGSFSIDNSSVTSVVAKVLENKIIDGGTGEINQAPSPPSNLRTLQDEQGIHLLWDAPTDDHTPSQSLTYDVVLYKNGQAVYKGMVNPANGMRTKLTTGTSFGNILLDVPTGNYEWKVQAVDQSFTGSPFSEVHSFFALPPLPGMSDTTIYKCNRTVSLTAVGTNIKWYADADKTTLLASGVYHPETSTTVFVTQTDNGAESYARKVVVSIHEKPDKPVTNEEIAFCENVSTSIQLSAVGTDLKWYSDAALHTPVGTGQTISATAAPSTYYVTQTIQACESNAVAIVINKVAVNATIEYENGTLRVMEMAGDFFEWFRNNEWVPSLGGTLPLNDIDGIYSVVVYKDGCSKQSQPFLVTGLPEEPGTAKMFPNPANDRVFIDNVHGDYHLIVYSTEGRIVLDQSGTARDRIDFSVSNWSKGLYAVTLGSVGQKFVRRLMIE